MDLWYELDAKIARLIVHKVSNIQGVRLGYWGLNLGLYVPEDLMRRIGGIPQSQILPLSVDIRIPGYVNCNAG